MSADEAVTLDELGAAIRDRIAMVNNEVETATNYLSDAGRLLLEAKQRIAETRETTFKAFLEQHGIGRSRAFELLALVEGRKSIDGLRARNAERQATHREANRAARQSVSNGPPCADTDLITEPEITKLKAQIEDLKRKLARAEEAVSKTKDEATLLEGRAQTIERELEGANLARLYAEKDKERLAAESQASYERGIERFEEILRNEFLAAATGVPTWLCPFDGPDRAVEHAVEQVIAEGVTAVDMLMIMRWAAVDRFNDFFGASMPWQHSTAGDKSWLRHADQIVKETPVARQYTR
jgi:hypothetical protein